MKIKSSRIWLHGIFMPACIQIENGRILSISPFVMDDDAENYGDRRIVPGFLDVHTHGAYMANPAHAEEKSMKEWISKLPLEGITGFLPTTYPVDFDVEEKSLRVLSSLMDEAPQGAEILGIHMEGPACNPEYKGAMNTKWMLTPTPEMIDRYHNMTNGKVRYMTIAAETDKDHAAIRHAVEKGIIVTIGHSAATFDEAILALSNGATCFTHAFNAMTLLHHRKPGCVGAIMRSDAFCEAIFDGLHVDYNVLNILFKTKGKDKIVGVSDSLLAKGLSPGEYILGGNNPITVHPSGVATITGTDTITGGTMLFNHGLQNMVEKGGIPFDWALSSITANPAAMLGLSHRIGHLRAGYDADIVVLEDNYDITATYCKGKKVTK